MQGNGGRFGVGILILAGFGLAAPTEGQIPSFADANLALGQDDFDSISFAIPPDATAVYEPESVAVDPTTGKVFVADSSIHRILRFSSMEALANNAPAEIAIGQFEFSDSDPNHGGSVSRDSLFHPESVFVDSGGRLWVADSGNNRVLIYAAASAIAFNGPLASVVFGQPDFESRGGGFGAANMSNPTGVWLDDDNHLWVADSGNNRVLRFDDAPFNLSNGVAADAVLGQPGFITNGSGLSATALESPADVAVDSTGTLWVADRGNNRVVGYSGAGSLSNGAAADRFFGEPSLTSSTSLIGAQGLDSPISVDVDAFGALWVADQGNNRVVRYDDVATKNNGFFADAVIGQSGFLDSSAGLAANRFDDPRDASVDAAGNLWIADFNNARVLQFLRPAPPPVPDTEPPVVSVLGPKTIDSLRKRVAIRGTATDESEIASVDVKVSRGATVKKVKSGARWKVVLIVTKDRGRVVAKIRLEDEVGNRSRFSRVTIRRR